MEETAPKAMDIPHASWSFFFWTLNMPGMCVHPPTYTQHKKKSSGLHPGIKGGGQQSDKSGPLQIKFDENAPLFSQN